MDRDIEDIEGWNDWVIKNVRYMERGDNRGEQSSINCSKN